MSALFDFIKSNGIPSPAQGMKIASPLYDYYGESLSFSPLAYFSYKYKQVGSYYSADNLTDNFYSWLLFESGFKLLRENKYSNKFGVANDTNWYENIKRKAILKVSTATKSGKYNIALIYGANNSMSDIINKINSFYIPPEEKKDNRISLVVQIMGELRTQEFKINIGDIDIHKNYGSDFAPIYQTILNRLNTKDDKGIVLLHGHPGTGKTSLIKYIAKQLTKEVIFIPPNMTESICSPGFLPFLLQHTNSVLIIEDAEKIIADRENKFSSMGVSNLLNISDGILGDCLNVQVIATFNTQKDKIDQALLRKGRLIAEHEFGRLSIDDSNNLLEHLGKKHRTTCEMTLTDIYNVDETEYKKDYLRQPIGFR